jgi:hypothetical protein
LKLLGIAYLGVSLAAACSGGAVTHETQHYVLLANAMSCEEQCQKSTSQIQGAADTGNGPMRFLSCSPAVLVETATVPRSRAAVDCAFELSFRGE